MFVDGMAAELRQGDVCIVPYLPEWRIDKVGRTLGADDELASVSLPLAKTVVRDGDGYLVSVCTQCCDIANPNGRSGIAVAPIRKIPLPRHEQERRAEVMRSYQPDGQRWSWVHLFPLQLPDGQAVVIDLASVTTLLSHSSAVDLLMDGKRHELTNEFRYHFRRKLAASFGRRPRDEGAAEGSAFSSTS